MSEKLIPCPICGSENTVRLPYNDRADIERCKNCNLTIIVPIGYTMWNTRPIEDALNARIAELEAEIERLTVHSDTERQDDKCSGHGDISNFPPVMGSGDGLGW